MASFAFQTEADVLSSLAFADARHDFSRESAANFFAVLQESLPGYINWISGDNAALDIVSRLSGNALTPVSVENANTLFQSLGGSSEVAIAIICDSSFCTDLLYRLSNNTIGKVYFIQNREIKNDPGNNIDTDHTQITLNILRDIHDSDITYPIYDATLHTFNTKLCSIFGVHMDLDGAVYETDEYVDYVYYEDNSTELPALIRKIGDYDFTNTELYQNISHIRMIQSAFLQKRSGDWLQVLSCVDRDREYEESDGRRRNLKNIITYFCSSDRIPIAYALYLGISCIRKRINPVTKEVSYYQFRNITDRISESHAHNMNSYYISKYTTYISGDSYVDAKTKLLHAIDLYEHHSLSLISEIQRVSEATTIEGLKVYLGYAIHYVWLKDRYSTINKHRQILNIFVENPRDERITDAMKCVIVPIIEHAHREIATYGDFDIHTPIYDEKFRVFNPTSYFVELHGLRYSIVFGQALLAMLLQKKYPELQTFVHQFVETLLPIVDSEIVRTHYSLFLRRYFVIQSGGSTRKPYNRDHLKFIGQYLLEYYMSNTFWAEDVVLRKSDKCTQRYTFKSASMLIDMFRTIVLDYGIIIDGFVDAIHPTSVASKLYEVTEFLKRKQLRLRQKKSKRNTLRRRSQKWRRITRRIMK